MNEINFRKLAPVEQENTRKKAIELIQSGKSVPEVASVLGVSRQAVYNWNNSFKNKGFDGLQSRKRGRPPKIKAVPQTATIEKCTETVDTALTVNNVTYGCQCAESGAGTNN